jgi:serine protease Do
MIEGLSSGAHRRHRLLLRLVAVLALPLALVLAAVSGGTGARASGPASVADIAEKLQNAVVNISTTQNLRGIDSVPLPNIPKGSPFEEFFRDFFDRQAQPDHAKKVSSLGSGFVIDPSGLIVTNHHVINEADEIIVKFNDGTNLKVEKILGRDPKSDLALLKVNPEKPLEAVAFGDSDVLRIGDWVMAIGNPFGLGGTLTVGVISAKKRDINAGLYDEFLQTDAAINRGNSGGPLFNMNGEVIGVNSAIISPTGGSIGIGFAIPSKTAKLVISQLQRFGEVRRGWLGVQVQTVTGEIAESLGLKEPKGALVSSVTPGGPADKAGIRAGDVIVSYNGEVIENMRRLPKLVAQSEIDKDAQITISRQGQELKLGVKVGQLDEKAETRDEEARKPPADVAVKRQDLLGLTLAPLNDKLRQQFGIDASVKGVAVTAVRKDSPAAEKDIQPGHVLVEVNQEEVQKPEQVAEIIKGLEQKSRKHVLLLVADSAGELRFVAVPIGD